MMEDGRSEYISTSEMISLTSDYGFTNHGSIDVSKLEFLPEVRAMCEANRCGLYGKSWSCPPACGTLEEIKAKAATFTHGFIVQSVGLLEDSFDYEEMQWIEKAHKRRFARMTEAILHSGARIMALGAGGCNICEKCTYPNEPCRNPDKVFPSMEACGLLVSKVCADNGIQYYYGPNHICFVSCYLYCDYPRLPGMPERVIISHKYD